MGSGLKAEACEGVVTDLAESWGLQLTAWSVLNKLHPADWFACGAGESSRRICRNVGATRLLRNVCEFMIATTGTAVAVVLSPLSLPIYGAH